MNIGMIGAGAWAGDIATCLSGMRGVTIAGVQNRTPEKAEQLAHRYGISKVYPTVEALCESADVDAVMVLTHESAHLEGVLCALNAGKHVFVEKPMADSSESAAQMVEAARQADRILMPGHIVRFTSQCRAAKSRADQSGRVRAIRCFQHRTKDMYATYCKPHLAFSLMIHHLDQCLWLTGCPVSEVSTVERFDLGEGYPSSVWATLQFENGAVATLQSGWVLDGPDPIFFEDGIEIVTDQDRISIRFNDDYEVRTPSGIHRSDVCYEPALRQELEYWLRCIENGEQPSTITAKDGVEAVALAERVVAAGEASGPGNG